MAGPTPLSRPSTVKSGGPSKLRVNEWLVASKEKSRSLTPVRQRQATRFGMTRRRLRVRAESQQTAIAILHDELAAVPWHVAKSPSEFHALGGVLGIQCVGIFNEQVGSFAQGL